jgi:multiple sugar transport system substrate-binding protein
MRKAILLALLAATLVATAGAQTINVLVWDDPLPRAIKDMLPEFEKATGYKVNFELQPTTSVITKTTIGVTKDRADYDVVAVDEGNVPIVAPVMLPFDKWPAGAKYPKTARDTVTAAMLDAATWDGVTVGFPINGNLYVWMTRKDLVENATNKANFKAKYGYELRVPQTFKELLDMGTFFNANGIATGFGDFATGSPGVHAEAIFMWESFGTKFIDRVNGKYAVVLDEKKAVEGMEFYKQLMAISPANAATLGHSERQAAFTTGKGIFSMFIWPNQIANYENPDSSLYAGKITYSAPPAGPAKRVAVRGCWIMAIAAASKQQQAAAEFVYWWASKEIGYRLADMNIPGARKDVLSDARYATSKPWYGAMAQAMDYAVARPRFPQVAQVNEIVKKYWLAGVTGSMPTLDAVRAIVAETNVVLVEANK